MREIERESTRSEMERKMGGRFNGRTAEIFRERKKEEERCLILLLLFYNKKIGNFLLTRAERLGYNPEFFFTTFNFGPFPNYTATQFLLIYIIHNY